MLISLALPLFSTHSFFFPGFFVLEIATSCFLKGYFFIQRGSSLAAQPAETVSTTESSLNFKLAGWKILIWDVWEVWQQRKEKEKKKAFWAASQQTQTEKGIISNEELNLSNMQLLSFNVNKTKHTQLLNMQDLPAGVQQWSSVMACFPKHSVVLTLISNNDHSPCLNHSPVWRNIWWECVRSL